MKIVEVKSTNIRNDLKVESDFTSYDNVKSVQKLVGDLIRRKDDVFCYPKLKRRESDPECVWMITAGSSGKGFRNLTDVRAKTCGYREMIAWECENQCCDIFVKFTWIVRQKKDL